MIGPIQKGQKRPTYDFHFMKQDPKTEKWYDKPGSRAVRSLGKINILHKFYKLVKTGGKWDLKNKSAWKLKSKKDYYIFFKDKLTAEDVGNVHFGFVGSVLFSSVILCTGTGIYQIISGTSDWKYWKSFFDDPRDTQCILIGHSYWSHYYRKYRFQW